MLPGMRSPPPTWAIRKASYWPGCAMSATSRRTRPSAAAHSPTPRSNCRTRIIRRGVSSASIRPRIRERLIRLCRDAKLADPERLADEVFLICEGARITAQSVGTEGLSARLAGMLEALVSEHARRGKEEELDGRTRRRRRKS